MKKGVIAVALLIATVATTLKTQAQTTTSEGNAANTAQSKSGNAKEEKTEGGKTRANIERKVTGSRPEVNSTSDKFRENNHANREKRSTVSSDADGKTDVDRGVRPKADLETKKKRNKGRTFGNTNADNN